MVRVVAQSSCETFSATLASISGGSPGQYLAMQKSGGEQLLNAVENLLKTTNLSDLKTSAQEILKSTDDAFVLVLLHQLLYQKAIAQPSVYANSTQAVERFLRFTHASYIDAAHRICAAVLLAQNPSQQQLIYG